MLTNKQQAEKLLLINELIETLERFISICHNEGIKRQLVARFNDLLLKYEYKFDIKL